MLFIGGGGEDTQKHSDLFIYGLRDGDMGVVNICYYYIRLARNFHKYFERNINRRKKGGGGE